MKAKVTSYKNNIATLLIETEAGDNVIFNIARATQKLQMPATTKEELQEEIRKYLVAFKNGLQSEASNAPASVAEKDVVNMVVSEKIEEVIG